MSERRHRLNSPEVSPVKDALAEKLRFQARGQDPEAELDFDNAMRFRVLYRLVSHTPGQPKYPPMTWGTVSAMLGVPTMVPLTTTVEVTA